MQVTNLSILFAVGTLLLPAFAEQHAILVAGSMGWSNYRHQADVAHAYRLLIEGGVNASNIVVMMYDDIAGSRHNKLKGQLFNRPDQDGAPAQDVYAAVKGNIDYKGSAVTPSNFLKVLTGAKDAPGPVLTSGADDDVFVYFADHGGVGNLAFPAKMPGLRRSKILHADQLNAALVKMYEQNMYKKLTIYVEACESGSMFYGLLNSTINVYAVTAANRSESSYGWYCKGTETGGAPTVQGKNLGVCLGDEFSVRWLEDTDAADETKETLGDQFDIVQKDVTKSHVHNFGDLSWAKKTPLAEFFGHARHYARAHPARRLR